MSFTHLHTHSHYSLLDGLAKVDQLVNQAKEYGMDSLALTDHGVMYGAIEFYQMAKEAGIKPIIGVETYVARNGLKMKRPKLDTHPYHLILLAKDMKGYENLIKLTTIAHLEGYYYKPRIDKEVLKKYSKGVIGLSACLQGEVTFEAKNGNLEKAEKSAKEYLEIFGRDNFFLELQYHATIPEQQIANEGVKKIARDLDIPLVATNDIHYLKKEDDKAHDVLICIQTQRTVNEKNRMSMLGEDFSMKSPEQMREEFKDTLEAVDNTGKVAEMCNVDIKLGEIKLPHYDVPKGEDADSYLVKKCEEGLQERYGTTKVSKEIRERLDYEVGIIKKTGYSAYFLITQDFIVFAKDKGIVVGPGRGSAAGSLVAYLLKITDLDPIEYDLIFERFLNPERVSMPDIDTDFADIRRDEVIEYCKKKYGKERVAQIITFGTMAARAAVRDAGRALGYPYSFCDQAAKLIPMFTSLGDALKDTKELEDFYKNDPQAKKLLDTALKLEGVARHASTHACGIVITKDKLEKMVPCQYSTRGDNEVVTQYSLHPVEDLGLLKMDFLGLKNLTIIEKALNIIRAVRGKKIDVNDVGLEDKKAYQLLQQGLTTGVFQLESSGMKRYLKQLKPSNIEDIIAMVALYRPGPMEWIPDYIAGKHGYKTPEYLHPKLEPILKKTFGVAIYQEQVMQMARDLAGFTMGQADVLRKAVGKKIKELLEEQKAKFIEGCVNNGIEEGVAKKIFEFIEPFAGYGFNRSHAACYGIIAYQTAYLKANFPNEFMAALLAADQENMDRVKIEIEECKAMEIDVLPPDVNESFSDFAVVKDAEGMPIRFGLSGIKNLGKGAISEIIKERKAGGKFKSLGDLLNRVHTKDLNKKSLEALAMSGALDNLCERNQVLKSMEKILLFSKNADQANASGQMDLFSSSPALQDESSNLELKLDEVEPASKSEKLGWEKELLGLYVSEHPFEQYKDYINSEEIIPVSRLNINKHTGTIKTGGVITTLKKITTKKGDPMAFATLEDMGGKVELLVFPSLFAKNPKMWDEGKVLIVTGKLDAKDGELKVLASQARVLDLEKLKKKGLSENSNKSLLFGLSNDASKDTLMNLKNVLSEHPGESKVYLSIPNKGGTGFKRVLTSMKVNQTEAMLGKVKKLLGNDSVYYI